MNKVILMGNLCKDPETITVKDIIISKTSLAVRRKFSKDNEVDFFNITAFGKTAEFLDKYFKKGSQVLLSGRIEIQNYTDKEGNKRSSTVILADEFFFASKANESKDTSTTTSQKPTSSNNKKTGSTSDLSEDEDELPF
jgi:single-strand DNA-binding protein